MYTLIMAVNYDSVRNDNSEVAVTGCCFCCLAKLPRTLLDILVQRVNQSDTGARGLAEKYKSLRADYIGSLILY